MKVRYRITTNGEKFRVQRFGPIFPYWSDEKWHMHDFSFSCVFDSESAAEEHIAEEMVRRARIVRGYQPVREVPPFLFIPNPTPEPSQGNEP